MDIAAFADRAIKLLEWEKAADTEMSVSKLATHVKIGKQQNEEALVKLRAADSYSDFHGKLVFKFSHQHGGELPPHKISNGDVVAIGMHSSGDSWPILTNGVVSSQDVKHIYVVLEKNKNVLDTNTTQKYFIVKLADEVNYKRWKKAMVKLRSGRYDKSSTLVDVCFKHCEPSTVDLAFSQNIKFVNPELNEEQQEAVRFSLAQKECAIIHGPPGTGKTTTLVEVILQMVSQGLKVLACAPSNVAVDNLAEKLLKYKARVVRLGHPARFVHGIKEFSLDAYLDRSDAGQVLRDIQKEMDELRQKMDQSKYGNRALNAKFKHAVHDHKSREKKAMKEILMNAEVVLGTFALCHEEGPLQYVPKGHFHVAAVDECSQALEVCCWIPLLQVGKCVLAGDHLQLPPVIKSEEAKEELSVTLMERLSKIYGDRILKMLTVQYRMNENIMKWVSGQLYENKLRAHESVATHLLKDLPGVESNDETTIPLLLIDTTGADCEEFVDEAEESKGNEGEADLVAMYVEVLVQSGVKAKDIGVITPYNLQVDFIRSRLQAKYRGLEIKSVDGFQGREKEAIVVSLVRSNKKGEIGFLSEDRRMNVAITRAKRHLAVICNSETVSRHPFLKEFIDYMSSQGEVRSAAQYSDAIGRYPRKRESTTSKENAVSEQNHKSKKHSNKKLEFDEKSSVAISKNKSSRSISMSSDTSTVDPVKEKYSQQIAEFCESKDSVLNFPSTLSSRDRAIIHEVAESFHLVHVSYGEGENRYIVVQKGSSVDDNKHQDNYIFKLVCDEDGVSNDDDAPVIEVPKSTGAVRKIAPTKPLASVQLKNNKKPLVKPHPLEKDTRSNEDFDAIIADTIKADKTCSYMKCKESAFAFLPTECMFCKRRFCMSHAMPEVHGCGDAVKAYSRSQVRKEVQLNGGVKNSKASCPVHRAQLHRMLNNKLNEKSKERKRKER